MKREYKAFRSQENQRRTDILDGCQLIDDRTRTKLAVMCIMLIREKENIGSRGRKMAYKRRRVLLSD